MAYLFRNRSISEDSRLISSHGPITVHQRPRSEWWNDEHHSHSLITRSLVGFKNPWKSFHKPTFWEVASGASLRKIEQTVHTVDERDPVEVAQESLEVVQPSWGAPWNQTSYRDRIRATWLGHAGVLVQFPPKSNAVDESGINVLVDPIFSERSSPAQWAGPARIVKTPCATADLPPIHVLIISHNQ
jgi:N-acyl-phosphatidylethanolamine-hydrolysing phospholipase D